MTRLLADAILALVSRLDQGAMDAARAKVMAIEPQLRGLGLTKAQVDTIWIAVF